MSVTPLTRPPAGKPEDYVKLGVDMDNRSRFHEKVEDTRLSQVFMWAAGILGTVVTVAICSGASVLFSMRSDIAVLLARPPSVAKDQYDRDYDRLSNQVNRVENRLTNIEERQINTVTKGR